MGKYWVGTGKNRHRTAAGNRREYEKWEGTEEGKAKRAARNAARRSAIRSGKAHKGDGKDVHHIHGVEAGNGSKNLRVISRAANRGMPEKSRKRGSKRKHYER